MTECCPRTVRITSDEVDVLLIHPSVSPPDSFAYVRDATVARICVAHGRTVYNVARQKATILDDKPAESPEEEQRRRKELLAWDKKRWEV